MDSIIASLAQVAAQLTSIGQFLYTWQHPGLVVASLLEDTLGLLLRVWNGFILTTTDFETGGDFVNNVTIQQFEPKMQLLANAALVLIAMWASFRIMWGHGLFTQYTARILLPRLFMAVVLINFALPMFQAAISATNVISQAMQGFVKVDDLTTFAAEYRHNANAATWEIITTAVLAVGYDVLAITYVVRYAILIVLAITSPLAALVFMLPETNHLSKMWFTHFTTNLFMQPAQLFVLAIGFALERGGVTPFHHLFALASLLIVFKVPGAMGGSEKSAHKLQSTVTTALHHLGHAVAKA